MVSRREAMAWLGTGAVAALGGCSALKSAVGDRDVPQGLSDVGGVPDTDEVIKSATPTSSGIASVKRIDMFRSGAAEITMPEPESCYEQLAFTHDQLTIRPTDTSEAMRKWDIPEFGGTQTVNMQAAVRSKSGYPSRRFKTKPIGSGGSICLSGESPFVFRVPESYMPP